VPRGKGTDELGNRHPPKGASISLIAHAGVSIPSTSSSCLLAWRLSIVLHNNEHFVLEHSDAMWTYYFSVRWLLLVSLPVAALVYILACRSMDLGAGRCRAEAADAGLE